MGTHDHGHSHDHAAGTTNRARLALALAVTTTVLLAEVVGSILTGSLALLVDAAHMLTDTVGLLIALVAAHLMTKAANSRRTWGFQRAEVVAAAAQAAVLLVVGCYAVVEGISRLVAPPAVAPQGLAAFGAIGLVANLVSLVVLSAGRTDNLNMRAAFLEVVNDALGSVAVLVSAAIIWWTGWLRADAVAGLLIALMIIPRALLLLRNSTSILMESTPADLDLDEVRRHIRQQEHVTDVHDLHASTVASGLHVLTAHVVLDDECFVDGHALPVLTKIQDCLAHHHGVALEHTTLQLESPDIAAAHRDHLHH